ncbi:MAG: hypothetical protein HS104_35695 [Polyangiaceae bacterium]|nr:hypothetical protein [Polyangiaceae bacterium]MCE7892643.1 DUF1573 domain-containing protein [Sorangiineae bacterium PRO1]MCL4750404.1 hypothetical protein [Myxococcales bacterium]
MLGLRRTLTGTTLAALTWTGSALADAGADAGAGPWDVLAEYCSATDLECTSAKLSYAKTVKLPIAFDFDTGWVPQGSDLQVRFFLKIPASTTVEMDGALQTTWPEAMTLATPGGTHGLLKFDYGLELGAKAKLDVSVIGVPVKWEGDIPYVPQIDFHLKAETNFAPWAFAPDVATATGSSPKLRMFEVNLLDMLGIPSQISKGGVALDISGDLTAKYQTERIRIEPAKVTEPPITKQDGTTQRAFPGGAFVEYDVFPEGRVDYSGTLHLIPTFFIEVLGKDFNIPVVDIPVSFDIGKQDYVFDAVRVHVPLPDLEDVVESLDFGSVKVGEDKTLTFTLANVGEAKARATGFFDSTAPKAFSTPTTEVLIESQKSATYSVKFSPDKSGKLSSVLTLVTNDPDERFLKVALSGTGLGTGAADAGPSASDEAGDEGGCGCRVGGGSGTPSYGVLVLLGLIAVRRVGRRPRR